MAIQPFTYDSIKTGGWLNGTSLAAPHGLGHGWAAVLWDLDWDLIDKHGFNPNVYGAWNSGGNNRALQYVIDGLKLQGCAPGLVVATGRNRRRDRGAGRGGHLHGLGDVRPPRPRLQRRPGDYRPRRQQRGVRHPSGLPGGLLRRHRTRADAQHGQPGVGRRDGVRRGGQPRPRHPRQRLPVLEAGQLHHAADGDTGGASSSLRGRCRSRRRRRATPGSPTTRQRAATRSRGRRSRSGEAPAASSSSRGTTAFSTVPTSASRRAPRTQSRAVCSTPTASPWRTPLSRCVGRSSRRRRATPTAGTRSSHCRGAPTRQRPRQAGASNRRRRHSICPARGRSTSRSRGAATRSGTPAGSRPHRSRRPPRSSRSPGTTSPARSTFRSRSGSTGSATRGLTSARTASSSSSARRPPTARWPTPRSRPPVGPTVRSTRSGTTRSSTRRRRSARRRRARHRTGGS